MRQSIINSSILRNDVEVFRFDSEQAGFGAGDAKIVSVRLLDKDDVPLSWIVGGEDVILEICCAIYKDMMRPLLVFISRTVWARMFLSITPILLISIRK